MKKINLLSLFKTTLIQSILESRNTYDNLYQLYNLNYDTRDSVLDLIRLRHIKIFTGEVFASGNSIFGVLGNGITDATPVKIPTLIEIPNIGNQKIIQVSSGQFHTLFLTDYGLVYSCGRNSFGRLGIGKSKINIDRPTPIDMTNMGNQYVIKVDTGTEHSLFLTNEGQVYACGNYMFGRLGIGQNGKSVSTPTLVQFPWTNNTNNAGERIIDIAAGYTHSLFVTENGQVYSTGSNGNGQLGSVILNINNNMILTPMLINTLNIGTDPVIKVAASTYHSLFLTASGRVFSSGLSINGRLGNDRIDNYIQPIPTQINTTNIGDQPIVDIDCSINSSFFVTINGDVFACGNARYGKLGNDETYQFQEGLPIPVLFPWNNVNNPRQSDVKRQSIVLVSAAANHTLFLTDEGQVYASGRGDKGRLGDGISSGHSQSTPIAIDVNQRGVFQIAAGFYASFFLI